MDSDAGWVGKTYLRQALHAAVGDVNLGEADPQPPQLGGEPPLFQGGIVRQRQPRQPSQRSHLCINEYLL
jgi:hypothetical protein